MINSESKNLTGCFLVIIAIISIPIIAIVYGYTLSILWRWFLMPIFPTLAKLSIPSAIGLSLTVRFITNQTIDCQPKEEEPWKKLISAILLPFISCGIILGFGWIVLKFL